MPHFVPHSVPHFLPHLKRIIFLSKSNLLNDLDKYIDDDKEYNLKFYV